MCVEAEAADRYSSVMMVGALLVLLLREGVMGGGRWGSCSPAAWAPPRPERRDSLSEGKPSRGQFHLQMSIRRAWMGPRPSWALVGSEVRPKVSSPRALSPTWEGLLHVERGCFIGTGFAHMQSEVYTRYGFVQGRRKGLEEGECAMPRGFAGFVSEPQ